MSIALCATILGEAGTRILNTLVESARTHADASDDPIYTIIEHWALDVVLSVDLQNVFITAHARFGHYISHPERWIEALSVLFEHGGVDVPRFADNLWRNYIFHLQDAPEALWNKYPGLQRAVLMGSSVELPRSWADWVLPLQTFMGVAEEVLIEQSPPFEQLLISEDVVTLLEETEEAQPAPQLPEAPRISGEQVGTAATMTAYLIACRDQIGTIDPRGYLRSADIAIPASEVYIPLRLVALSDRDQAEGYIRYQTATYRDPRPVLTHLPLEYPPPGTDHDVTVQEAIRNHSVLIILGENGAGKTMLLRCLLLEYVTALLDHEASAPQYEGHRDGSVSIRLTRPLPVYVDLAQYIDRRTTDESLDDFAYRAAAGLIDDVGFAAILSDLAAAGDCLFLLDGLDQVASEEQRRALAASVAEAAERWQAAGNRVVVTGRLSSYDAAPLPPEFPIYQIRGLDRIQIGSFIYRWSLTLARARYPFIGEDEAHHQAENRIMSLRREVNKSPEFYALARNPLMLRLLVGVYQPGMILAPYPAGIYQLTTDLLIREWHLPQSVSTEPAILEHEAIYVLGQLAFWMHQSRPDGMLDERNVRRILANIWAQMHPEATRDQANEAVNNFLEYARDGNGVFIELAPRQFGFIFHGVQEYFAARYLVSSYRHADRRIRANLHNPRWDEVIRLAIGFTVLRSQEDASDLLGTAILARGRRAAQHEHAPSPFEDLLKRDLLFAANLLGSGVEVGPAVTRQVTGELMALWLDGERDSLGRLNLIFDRVRHHLVKLSGTSASQYAFQIASARLAHPDEHQRAFAIDALTFWPNLFDESLALLVAQGRDIPPLIRRAVAHALGRMRTLPVEAYNLLIYFAIDADEQVSAAAKRALQQVPPVPNEVLSMWLGYLRSNDPTRRRIALRVLRQIGTLPADVVDELLHLLNIPDQQMRQMVMDTLAAVQNLPEHALTAICRAARTTDSDIRIPAIHALSRPVELPPEVIEYLIDWTYDPEVAVRRAASQVLGTCQNETDNVIEALVERLLSDPADSVRAEAVELLARKGGDRRQVIHVLAHTIRDPIPSVRCAVASALRHYPQPDEQLREALKTLLSDREVIVRETALDTIAELRDPGQEIINEYLIPLTHMQDSGIGAKAVRALSSLRNLPDNAQMALVDALPSHWETQGRQVAECIEAHTPLGMEVVNAIMDLSVLRDIGTTRETRVPTGLLALALEMLGYALEDSPDVTRVLIEAATRGPGTEVQVAALRGLAGARSLWPDIRHTLTTLLDSGPLEVRCAAARTLGALIRSLPDPLLRGEEMIDLAGRVANLLRQITPRAAWEANTEAQNELLYALNAIVARARITPPRLSAYSEDPAGQLDE